MEQMQFPQDHVPVSHSLRIDANAQGGALLIYQLIMNVCVIATVIVACIVCTLEAVVTGQGNDSQVLWDRAMDASGWGYLAAVILGFGALLIWKKPAYVVHTIGKRGRPMTLGSFMALLSLAMAAQLISQLCNLGLQGLLEALGADMAVWQQMGSVDTSSIAMFLYVGILAPISEELLFRGVLLRSLASHSKKLAILVSAILFGLFHGNLIQTPYAIVVGLVLGYVALEYHVIWAIAIHIFNNLVFAMLLPNVLAFLPMPIVDLILWTVIIAFFVAGLLVLMVKREQVVAQWHSEKTYGWQWKAVLGAPTMVVLLVVCGLNICATMLFLFL